MAAHKQLLTSTANIFTLTASLLCTSHMHSMMTTGSIKTFKQLQKFQQIQQYSLYQQATRIGDQNCSVAYINGTCANTHCCKNLYNGSGTHTFERWKEAEQNNEKKKDHILKTIDKIETRTQFIDRTHQRIKALSTIAQKAYAEYKYYNQNIIAYKEICELINHKHHCMLNQLHIVEDDIHNLWKECQSFTIPQLQVCSENRQKILDLIALCEQEPVLTTSSRLLNAKIDRDRIISKQIAIAKNKPTE